jgi:hypothetical protein
MPSVDVEQLVTHLYNVRKTQGEEAYRASVKEFVKTLMKDPNGGIFLENFVKNLAADWLNLDELRQEMASEKPKMPDIRQLIQQLVPSIRTQGQYDLYMQAFSALSLTMDAYYSHRDATVSRDTLNRCLDMAGRVARLVDQAEEIPEEERGKETNDFLKTPAQFSEADEHQRLLDELGHITTLEGLNRWYGTERSRIERIVTAQYRNPLFDAIRAKKAQLTDN